MARIWQRLRLSLQALLVCAGLGLAAGCERLTEPAPQYLGIYPLSAIRQARLPSFRHGRKLFALLPLKYDRRKPLPVVVFLDGERMFTMSPSSRLVQALPQLWESGRLRPFLALGIAADSVHRLTEYDYRLSDQYPYWNGHDFLDAIADTLLPALSALVRANIDTSDVTFAGFSLGGLLAAQSAWAGRTNFANVIALSPTYNYRNQRTTDWIAGRGPPSARRYFHATGSVNDNAIADVTGALLQLGYVPNKTLLALTYDGCTHSEFCWGLELMRGLRFTQPVSSSSR